MEIYDLRSAIEYLKSLPGQIVETDVEVDTEAELSGVYRYVGAGGTVMRRQKQRALQCCFTMLRVILRRAF